MVRLITIYAIFCLIAFFGALLQPIIVTSTAYANFFPNAERFTELYFEDHLSLPSVLTPYTEYSFRFTIHNLTGEHFEYRYQVSTEIDGETYILNQNTVGVEKGVYTSIQEKFITVQEIPARSKIVVTLMHNNQHIAFWMEAHQ